MIKPEPAAKATQTVLAWQQAFYPAWHARYSHLANEHLRALAWLLASPDLLDAQAQQWQAKIATLAHLPAPLLAPSSSPKLSAIELQALEVGLQQAMQAAPQTRIGRYAEKLLAFYFQQQGVLHAQGLQVRVAQNPVSHSADALETPTAMQTVGEFDFLLQPSGEPADGLWHWEFATKFYLFAPALLPRAASDYFIGPNLADSLGAKMDKILRKQLALGQHAQLPYAIVRAQALIKGWMFYPYSAANEDSGESVEISGIEPAAQAGLHPNHCRGFWCSQKQLPHLMQRLQTNHMSNLARLRWLAPSVLAIDSVLVEEGATAQHNLTTYFEQQNMPVLFALMRLEDGQGRGQGLWQECGRVFVVPDDWMERAQQAAIPQSSPAH